ncbi:flagellar biosynthetic protein FliR [Sulfurimonas sp. HSL-1716]|uniref:flagellar biosynthetic protein FliR n=1 Tax=Hydrocurvibacter sulfurireducens TaxID=3131937 RepID=UPI0031F9EA22
MNYATIFTDTNIVGFLLLFFRFASLFIAVPIFSHQSIPIVVKTAMAFFFTVVFYASMKPIAFEINVVNLILATLSELLFGLIIGIVLQLAFNVITFAGGQISFVMGFSMASAIDPQSGVSMPIVSQFLSLMALMMLFSLNLHHWMLLFIDKSLSAIPLGGFIMSKHIFSYIIHAASNMFVIGFTIAFPLIALSWMADIIFGMLMKTMPQFNLLVIGFPIKIVVSFAVLIATFASAMLIFKIQMQDSFNWLGTLF